MRGSASRRTGPYPFGQIPDSVVYEIGRQLVHRIAIGQSDISGDDFGTIFAAAISGEHRATPLGLADVSVNGCAWSIKTVKNKNPYTQKIVRLISGRNSPNYSVGIENPHENPSQTGKAVINIWNSRVDEALNEFDDLRIVVLVRDMVSRRFSIFEEEARRYNPSDFAWTFNKRGNLEGRSILNGEHRFTWQPHGSQFTVRRVVPASARQFSINQNIPIVETDSILAAVRFNPSWITIRGQG